MHLGQAIFHFAGIDSINDAERLRGLEVQVPFSERFAFRPDRHYISDLLGCAVWEQGAAGPLGTVREVQNAGEGARGPAESWLLAVETPRGELLIPLAAEICTLVDTDARRIEVRLPEGLLDLNRVTPLRVIFICIEAGCCTHRAAKSAKSKRGIRHRHPF